MKKIIKIIIGISILLLCVGVVFADNVKPFQTPYNTTGKLNIGDGMIPEETGVTEDIQILAFNDGWDKCYFISTSKDNAADLIQSIQSGKKCKADGVEWYHLEDKQLANSHSAFGTHLKLETVNEMNVGYLESPTSDEVIVLVAPPDTIINCFKSIQWG